MLRTGHTGSPYAKFKMQVRTGGVAGLTYGADTLPGRYRLSAMHKQILQVGIQRLVAIGVQDAQIVSVTAVGTGHTGPTPSAAARTGVPVAAAKSLPR